MSSIKNLLLSTLSAALLFALALPASAAYLRVHADASDMAVLDSGAPDKNITTDAIGKLLVNYCDGEVTSKGRTVVLLRIPEAVLSADAASLARADLVFAVPRARNWDPSIFTPVLAPLDESYVAAEATWNQPCDGGTWTVEGAKVLDTSVDGTYRTNSATLSFNLLPLLADPAAAAALATNGAAIRLAWTELPEADSFAMLQLSSTAEASAAVPDVYFVLDNSQTAPAADMLVLDQGTPDKHIADAIGKLLVNYEDGAVSSKGVTAFVLTIPPAIVKADPATLSEAVIAFSVAGARNWDGNIFTPVLSPLSETFSFAQATWTQRAESTPWTTAGGTALSTSVSGIYDADSASLTFDLLPLLADATAAAALAANGARISLGWTELPEANAFAMLRVNTTQADAALAPVVAWTRSPDVQDSDIATVYYIDASEPNANKITDSVRFIVNADPDKGDTRVLVALPDLDLPTIISLGNLHFEASLNWRGNPEIPAYANVLTTPFGTTEATAATWNYSDHSDTSTAWNGGTFNTAYGFPATFGASSVDIDLSTLFASEVRDAAFANGLVLQWDTSQRDLITNSHVKHTLYRTGPAPALEYVQRPVTHSYIDSGKPNNNFGWSGANKGKCLVVFNPGEGEARSLLKFAPSFFDFDPAQQAAFFLTIPYGREWPAEEDADEDNSLVINPLTRPFRMDQATWNKADNDTEWTTAGGDYDPETSVTATIERYVVGSFGEPAGIASFDLTELFHNTNAVAALRDNGAVLRLGNAAHPVETSTIGFNLSGYAPETEIEEAAALEFRAAAGAFGEGTGSITLDLTGLDPLKDYELWSCSDLVAGDWAYVCDVPDDGLVTQAVPAGSAFYRVQVRAE
jgi:hypothetical protein